MRGGGPVNQAARVVEDLRQSGIEPLGPVPWGAHMCLFYDSPEDLLDAVVPYLAAGARNNERCLWAMTGGLTVAEAQAALGRQLPDLERRLADRAIEILPGRDWYLPDGRFDMESLIRRWHETRVEALEQGFDGLRVSGDTFWVESPYREGFHVYEQALERSLDGQKMLVLCTYPAQLSRAADVLDVTRTHQVTLARRKGGWEVLETAELIRAKQDLIELQAELEARVRLRTQELAAANAQLRTEYQERERAEAALAEAQAELARAARLTSLGVLAASIAHEVNQPLAAIVTNSEASMRLVAAEPPDIAEARAALGQIAYDARRASDVIKRLRALVTGAADFADVDINAAIREVAALMRSQLQARRIELRLDLDPHQPHLLGDRLQLQQAIMNLVGNAAEATGRAGPAPEVTVRSTVDGDGAVTVAVADKGPGVDPGIADRLFDPFFTTKAGGMGMGLSIVRSVAEAHGGRVSVSGGPAEGALFELTLPNQRAAA